MNVLTEFVSFSKTWFIVTGGLCGNLYHSKFFGIYMSSFVSLGYIHQEMHYILWPEIYAVGLYNSIVHLHISAVSHYFKVSVFYVSA